MKKHKKPLLRVVIVRAKWQHGRDGDSALVCEDGKQCCLGFVGKAIGFTDEDMAGVAMPSDVGPERWPDGMVVKSVTTYGWLDSEISNKLAAINDSSATSRDAKELALRKWGPDAGIEFIFEGTCESEK